MTRILMVTLSLTGARPDFISNLIFLFLSVSLVSRGSSKQLGSYSSCDDCHVVLGSVLGTQHTLQLPLLHSAPLEGGEGARPPDFR